MRTISDDDMKAGLMTCMRRSADSFLRQHTTGDQDKNEKCFQSALATMLMTTCVLTEFNLDDACSEEWVHAAAQFIVEDHERLILHTYGICGCSPDSDQIPELGVEKLVLDCVYDGTIAALENGARPDRLRAAVRGAIMGAAVRIAFEYKIPPTELAERVREVCDRLARDLLQELAQQRDKIRTRN